MLMLTRDCANTAPDNSADLLQKRLQCLVIKALTVVLCLFPIVYLGIYSTRGGAAAAWTAVLFILMFFLQLVLKAEVRTGGNPEKAAGRCQGEGGMDRRNENEYVYYDNYLIEYEGISSYIRREEDASHLHDAHHGYDSHHLGHGAHAHSCSSFGGHCSSDNCGVDFF